jgi:hypothetical protein
MNLRFEEIGQKASGRWTYVGKHKRRSALLAARRSWDLRDVSSWPEGRRRGGGEDPWPCDHAFTEMMLGSDGGNSIYGSITYSNSIQVGERALGNLLRNSSAILRIERPMDRDRKAGILLVLAAGAFLVGALVNDPRQPLTFVAAAALLVAGILRLRRSRRL